MRELQDGFPEAQVGSEAITTDEGLRRYMLGVYNKVGLGLLLAAAVACATARRSRAAEPVVQHRGQRDRGAAR